MSTKLRTTTRVFAYSLRIVDRLLPSLYDDRAISRQLLYDLLACYNSLLKLDFVLSSGMRNVASNALCEGESGTAQNQNNLKDLDPTLRDQLFRTSRPQLLKLPDVVVERLPPTPFKCLLHYSMDLGHVCDAQ